MGMTLTAALLTAQVRAHYTAS